MQVFFKVFIFLSILNSIITKTVKDVMENNNAEVNKGKETTQSRADLSLILNITVALKSLGKWHVGRVSRKQYEIINMLWRKTKIFIDTETTKSLNNSLNVVKHKRDKNAQHVTLVNHNPIQESFQLAHPKSKVYSSTPSYIEFYYLDELDERIKHKENTVKNTNNIIISEIFGRTLKAGMSRSPFFLFRVNEATCKATTDSFSHHSVKFTTIKPIRHDNIKKTRRPKTNKKDKIHASTNFYRDSITGSKINNSLTVSLPTSKFKKTELKQQTYKTSEKGFLDIMNKYASAAETTSAVNDHIRFFDIYDSDINTPYNNIEDDEDKIVNSNILQNEEKINLNQVDYSAKLDDKNKTRYVKKHINQNKDHLKRNYEFYNLATTISDNLSNPTKTIGNRSRLTHWSEFPFVAVYVYEPTQVRCDSASISPHWLVASATCLNRHHKDIKAEGRSAFVAYCSGNWRHPGRISYVKQSLIHPRFHPKDNSRRQLYNIGAIKVVNSMADTCNGWAPITLMTHQFTAASDGTLSTALGWGLDRYDARYSLTELPKYLTLYEGIIHSDSCPGNTGYNKAKSLDAKSIKNVYCLSLPPYAEEEKDAIHGSILLIGGKLIALYMQEERRRRGNQSAQYTGIWHLIPWLLDVAREPDELDPFSLEI